MSDGLIARYATRAVALAAGALVWQWGAAHTNGAFLASFTATMARLWSDTTSGVILDAIENSMSVFVTGLALAILLGLPFGLLLARVRLLRVALESYIMLIYATPLVAIIPFILSMMGFGFWPKVMVVFLFAFFSVLYNTVEGARSIKPELIEVARSFRSNERQMWRDVLVPYTLPFAMTGIRQAIGRGLVGLITAEFLLSGSGIGLLIQRNGQDFDVPGLYSAILLVTLIGVALMSVGRALEARFSAWREPTR
jgi:ABC-type nitrate/sulfonate/bicarbonate transport system permease component